MSERYLSFEFHRNDKEEKLVGASVANSAAKKACVFVDKYSYFPPVLPAQFPSPELEDSTLTFDFGPVGELSIFLNGGMRSVWKMEQIILLDLKVVYKLGSFACRYFYRLIKELKIMEGSYLMSVVVGGFNELPVQYIGFGANPIQMGNPKFLPTVDPFEFKSNPISVTDNGFDQYSFSGGLEDSMKEAIIEIGFIVIGKGMPVLNPNEVRLELDFSQIPSAEDAMKW